MPCLVQVTAIGFGQRRQYDVTFAKPVDFVPGTKEIENAEGRYLFFYITDRDFDSPDLAILFEDETTGTVEVEPGVFVDEKTPLRRVRRVNAGAAGGQLNRFRTYHPWGADGSSVPSNVKFTWAQVSAFVENHT